MELVIVVEGRTFRYKGSEWHYDEETDECIGS